MSACKERNWLRRNFEMKVLANNWPIWKGSSKPCCIATHHRHQPSTEKVKQVEKIIIKKFLLRDKNFGWRKCKGGKEWEKRRVEECCDQVRNTALLIRNRSFGSWLDGCCWETAEVLSQMSFTGLTGVYRSIQEELAALSTCLTFWRHFVVCCNRNASAEIKEFSISR